jgi:CTP:molybdopterin cytidylyltransferase MocA
MLSSLQLGIRRLEKTRASAALISPADIPDVKVETLLTIMRHWRDHGATLISPSYQRRGGHPILVGRPAWKEILSLVPGDTLRAFLRERDDQRAFVGVEDAGILRDIDTPGDYADAHPTGGE